MFHHITGTVAGSEPNRAVIDCGGVGFLINTSTTSVKALPPVGAKATMYTYLSVREDALDLYGFVSEQELSCFRMLLAVSGVGPKVALSILSEMSNERLAMSIVTGDAKALTKASGVGSRLAQRIILELKDKLKGTAKDMDGAEYFDETGGGDAASEAANALMVLGYSRREADMALSRVDRGLPLEQMVKEALKQLMRQV